MKLNRRGILFVLSSPSGAGKSSIAKNILNKDKNIRLSISYTTRKKRKDEVKGKDYNYISIKEFKEKIKANYFIEWAKVFDNYYGTPLNLVQNKISNGIDVLFDIDWQGTQQLSKYKDLDFIKIFILPPSKKELEKRLYERNTCASKSHHGRQIDQYVQIHFTLQDQCHFYGPSI